jgi:hypothetical protein
VHFHHHFTINHRVGFIDSSSGVYINTIEGNWPFVKHGIPKGIGHEIECDSIL